MELFIILEISNRGKFRMEDGKTAQLEGIGTVELHSESYNKKVLNHVYLVKKCTHNLLRLGQLKKKCSILLHRVHHNKLYG